MRLKLAVSFVLLIGLTSGFFGLDYALLARNHFYDISIPLDRWIPLSPSWIWIYLLYYPLCLLLLFFPGVLRENRLFAKVVAGLLIQFVIAWPIFYFFPTRIPHPQVLGDSWSAMALRGLYLADPGYCVFPSLHVANSFYISLLAVRFWPAAWSLFLLLISGLIAVSILMIKQHLFLDIPSGILLGAFGYSVAWSRLFAGPRLFAEAYAKSLAIRRPSRKSATISMTQPSATLAPPASTGKCA